MRKITKLLSALALSVALCAGMAGTALAGVAYQDRDVVVTGAGSYTETDLFDGFKDVMPGDELDQGVTVENASAKKVRVYLRAEAHDEAANPLSGSVAESESVATMSDFLAQLDMTVAAGGRVVFQGSPDEEGGLAENVLLGELAPGAGLEVDVALSVPAELGNDYASRVGEVDWVFTVEEVDEIPKTGDGVPVALVGAVAAIAAIALIASFVAMRRRRG